MGFGTQADIVTAYNLDYNGNGITVSNDLWSKMKPNVPTGADGKPVHPITAASIKPLSDAALGLGLALWGAEPQAGIDHLMAAGKMAGEQVYSMLR